MPIASSMLNPRPLSATTACRVAFGASVGGVSDADPHVLRVAVPVLGGAAEEWLLPEADPPRIAHGCRVFDSGSRLAGFALADPALDLESAAVDLYQRLFAVTRGAHLHRIWNYVPNINAISAGLENYRRFCRGRSIAFEKHFGSEFQQRLPAASGVGAIAGPLALAFLAGPDLPRHLENPQQIPAFQYPAEYGPRPPSFSRATRVAFADGGQQVFISGTAAIRGHATIAPGELAPQVDCTIENLRIISATAGAGDDLGASAGWRRTFKVYLRRAPDLAAVQSHLARALFQPGDAVSYLHADVCRADLLIEIEAVLTKS